MLYTVDRMCLQRSACPIIVGRLAAVDYCPIHTEVLDFIKGGHRHQAQWSRHVENEGFYVALSADEVAIQALSRFEIGVLNEVSNSYLGADDWDVAHAARQFPEYQKRAHPGASTPIDFADVIDAVGRKDKDRILQDAAEKAYFDKMFARGKDSGQRTPIAVAEEP